MRIKQLIFSTLVALITIGCDEDETSPLTSLFTVTTEPAGANCPLGGHKLESGFDKNRNAVLDTEEVQTSSFICQSAIIGPEGLKSLISVSIEQAGANCSAGGHKLESGIDKNRNNILDPAEIETAVYICQGERGKNGMVLTSQEAPGANCAVGGVKIITGLDTNSNGSLETTEIQSTSFLCNGDNGKVTILNQEAEPVGSNCSTGGIKLSTGLDANGNGLLDNSEIQKTEFICNASGTQDIQVKLKLGYGYTFDKNGWTYTFSELLLFNKNFYPNVDSAVLVLFDIKTTDVSSQDVPGTGQFELFDITNNRGIDNSIIIADDIGVGNYRKSANIINDLPNTTVNLGLKGKSNGDFFSSVGFVYLILYRTGG